MSDLRDQSVMFRKRLHESVQADGLKIFLSPIVRPSAKLPFIDGTGAEVAGNERSANRRGSGGLAESSSDNRLQNAQKW